ncbi:hypothetical protein [Thalassolituus hydrocarboniclasticus]|uniref:Lipoprotein n=1 Tax=Thalassolituus hydrocarboniclasticus TaxID=2742796 RepID=A0ABY6AF26_9GAMM|nr:hypothetical protein [Thalassolituus hydrocarboniclasticus]UXD88435.1 hypothetical protein HUF19_13830 [Thalassolituus hydrocarboniclasticus]
MRNLYILLLGLFLSGCGLEVSDTDQPVSTTSSIVIYNKAFTSLNAFYISDGSGYGPNQIEGKFISTGQSYKISGVECGKTYTLKVVRTDATEVIQKDVPIDCGFDYVWKVE